MRRPVPVAADGVLGDYIPFNFCPRSVMLYVVSRGHAEYSGGGSRILHLDSSVGAAVALRRPWAFTDRHAELGYTNFFDSTADAHKVDWSVMPLRIWNAPEARERRQAEFLVHRCFDWAAIEAIGVRDDSVQRKVAAILGTSPHKPPIPVHRDWYYD